VLEEVRLLSGVETTKEKVLRIILAGQPELNEKLNSPELLQLTQRIRLRFHLTPLSKADTRAYVQHRLEVAGSQGRQIFNEACYSTIFRYTGGTPRLINTLCDTAMMASFARDCDTVALEDVETAIRELQWVEFSARVHRVVTVPMTATTTATAHEVTQERATPATHVARVLLASGGQTVLERQLGPGRLIIGRTPDNDLQIDSKFISRHHCQIITTAESCVIEDLNSTNGIYVKAKRVRKHNLNDGDVVVIGKHELMYIDERAPKHRSAPDSVETQAAAGEQAWGE
jgi:hypothetical protein